jgi:uncharacterized membrane protein YcaP (DUF421 family)
MTFAAQIDWSRMLAFQTPVLEIFLRGTLTYLALFALLRLMLKRQQGGMMGVTDLLVIVLIADAAQNAMADDYTSVPDGILLVATILGWSYTLDWLGYQFPRFERLLHPPPLPLVKDGCLLRRNMRRELVTEEELMSQLREQGVERVAEVKMACMEGDGRLSIITAEGKRAEGQKPSERPGG